MSNQPEEVPTAAEVATLLDRLVQVVSESTRGGNARTLTITDEDTFLQKWEALSNEVESLIRMQDQRNRRAAAQRRQRARERTLGKPRL